MYLVHMGRFANNVGERLSSRMPFMTLKSKCHPLPLTFNLINPKPQHFETADILFDCSPSYKHTGINLVLVFWEKRLSVWNHIPPFRSAPFSFLSLPTVITGPQFIYSFFIMPHTNWSWRATSFCFQSVISCDRRLTVIRRFSPAGLKANLFLNKIYENILNGKSFEIKSRKVNDESFVKEETCGKSKRKIISTQKRLIRCKRNFKVLKSKRHLIGSRKS